MPDSPRMRPFARRSLTSGEIALGKSVFGDEIDWARVRLAQAPRLGFGAMVPLGRTIVFSKWSAAEDFSATSLYEQGWLVHELTHVWQARRGVVLAAAKLNAVGSGAYAYAPRADALLRDYNIERQAEIARHLFLARAGAAEEGQPDRKWLEAIWSGR
ncbi:hypothetical protein [Terricaulis sp.]|uniref:hypothetical protein n=1 Tax=Terricaulis sp. TaxID=2768686 RepID=UPI003783312B